MKARLLVDRAGLDRHPGVGVAAHCVVAHCMAVAVASVGCSQHGNGVITWQTGQEEGDRSRGGPVSGDGATPNDDPPDGHGGDPTTSAISAIKARRNADIESIVYVSWEQHSAGTGHVEYRFDSELWMKSPTRAFAVGPNEQILLGIPYDTAFEFRIVNDTKASAPQGFQTGPYPDGLPPPNLLTYDAGQVDPTSSYLLGSINEAVGGWDARNGQFWKWIIDRQGRVVWALLTPERHWTLFQRISYDGDDLLWDQATFWSNMSGAGKDSRVHRMKIDGTITATYETPGLHHAFAELPDASIAWGDASSFGYGGARRERLMKVATDGNVTEVWNCRDNFINEFGVSTSCWSNTLFWHEATDTFLYCFPTPSDTVVALDHRTGNTLWYAGNLSGGYAFEPSEVQFWMPHGVHYTESGSLLLSTMNERDGSLTVAREYEVDKNNESLREIWSYTADSGIFAETAGEAHRLDNGNTLHNYGSNGRVREVTDDGVVVWDVEWEGERLIGRTVFISDLYAFAP